MINFKQSSLGLLVSLLGCATIAKPADLVKPDHSATRAYIYQPKRTSAERTMITDLTDLDKRLSYRLSCLSHVSPQSINCQDYQSKCVSETNGKACQKEWGPESSAYHCSEGCKTETYFAEAWEVQKSECRGAYADIGEYSDGSRRVEVFVELNQGVMLLYTKEYTKEYLQSFGEEHYFSSEVYPVIDAIDEYCKASVFPKAYEATEISKEYIDNIRDTPPPTCEQAQESWRYEDARRKAWEQGTLEERKAWKEENAGKKNLE